MAAHIIHWFARRRVEREEAETLRLYEASRPRNDPCGEAQQPSGTPGDDQARYASLPYTPRCCAVEGQAAHAYPIQILQDIPYWTGPGSSARHQLDIYFSPEAIKHHRASQVDRGRKGVPVTVHVHGGGWQRGDRKNEWRGGPNAGRSIARHGMIAVVPSYRLAPPSLFGGIIWFGLLSLILTSVASIFSSWVWNDFRSRWLTLYLASFAIVVLYARFDRSKARHPEAVLDVCRAVKWVREHLSELVPDADVDRVFLSGHSAGGHLVTLASLDPKYYRQVGLEDTSFIRGVCSVSGVYSLLAPVNRDPRALKNIFFRMSYGAAAFGTDHDQLVDASPITHVRRGAPPFLVMSASNDLGLEVDAQRFCEQLDRVNAHYEYHVIQNTSHASIASQFEKHQAHQHLFRFIDKCCSTSRNGGDATAAIADGRDPCCDDPEYVHVQEQAKSPRQNGSRKKKSSSKKKQPTG